MGSPVPDDVLLQRIGGAAPAGGQDVTANGVQMPPSSPLDTAPITFAEDTKAPAATGGRELLPSMAWSAFGVESGRQHQNEKGEVKVNPKSGAVGEAQLMPETAKDLGVDPYDRDQNVEGGRRYLGQMYDKYGDWTKALMAYNWGSGNVDKWIAQGADPAKVPEETRKYVPKVLAGLGYSTDAGAKLVSAKGAVSDEDLMSRLEKHVPGAKLPGASDETSHVDPESGAIVDNKTGAVLGYDKETESQRAAFLTGARRGAQNLLLGPVQAVLEQAAPGVAQELTAKVNEMEAPYEADVKAHGGAAFAGEILGTAGTLLAVTGLARRAGPALGMPLLLADAVRALPAAVRIAGTGFAYGATVWNKDPAQASRLAEGLMGSAFGLLGAGIAKKIGSVLTSVASRDMVNSYLGALKAEYGELTPSLSGIKDAIVSRYKMLNDAKNRMYGLRNRYGQTIEGYPSGLETGEGVAGALNKALGETAQAGVRPTPGVRSVAAEMDRALGLPEQRAAQKAAEVAERQHTQAMEEWQKHGNVVGNLPEPFKAQALRKMQDEGVIPPMPVKPPPFESQPISPEQMSQARVIVNQAVRRAKDPITRTQLGMLKSELADASAAAAREAGLDVVTFERRAALADKFMREKIGPIRDALGRRDVARAEAEITPAEMYDRVIKLVSGGTGGRFDSVKFTALHDILGEKGRTEASRAVMSEIFSRAVTDFKGSIDLKKLVGTVREWEPGLRAVLGREEFEKLLGVAKIGENLAAEWMAKKGSTFHRHPLFLLGAMWRAFGGHYAEAAVEAVAPFAMDAIMGAAKGIHASPRLAALLPRAAKADPEGPEMREIIRQIDVVARRTAGVAGRETAQRTGGEPLNTGGRIAGQVVGGGLEAVRGLAP